MMTMVLRLSHGRALTAFAALVTIFTLPGSAAEFASGNQIRRTIIGSTIEGVWTDNTRFAAYYDPDGSMRGYEFEPRHSKVVGTWSINGNQLCMRWTYVRSGGNHSACNRYAIGKGKASIYRNGRWLGVTVTVRRGNGKKF